MLVSINVTFSWTFVIKISVEILYSMQISSTKSESTITVLQNFDNLLTNRKKQKATVLLDPDMKKLKTVFSLDVGLIYFKETCRCDCNACCEWKELESLL